MFDFSKEIKLNIKDYSFYKKAQIILYLLVFFSFSYLSYLIIFPHKYFFFSFLNSSASENNINQPYLSGRKIITTGQLAKNENLFFNTDIVNDYSTAKITLSLDETLPNNFPTISARRSYEAFFYETGMAIGFRDGSLLKEGNNFYIISNKKLRKFSSSETINRFNYSKDSFWEVSKSELSHNQTGEEIFFNENYPDSTLFQIENDFYILENQKLKKFLSDKAFLSNYEINQAIKKDVAFLDKYPLSENLAGFSDGTLVSNDISVYIISQNMILPIDSPETFQNKGYSWDDVIPIGSDELSFYEKAKTFNIRSPHPNGTIFKTIEDSNYYQIFENRKYPLPSETIARSWFKKNPIIVSQKSLETSVSCETQKKIFQTNIYECKIPLELFSNFTGFDYQFNINTKNSIKIKSIEVDYKKDITLNNFKAFAKKIIYEIKINYATN